MAIPIVAARLARAISSAWTVTEERPLGEDDLADVVDDISHELAPLFRKQRLVASYVERPLRTYASVDMLRRLLGYLALTVMKQAAAASDGLRLLGPNPQGAEEFWREKDGAIVVRVPGGEFQMGSPQGAGESSEHPRHAVRLRGFLMDKTEVTWGQYVRFARDSSRHLPESPVWGMPEALPVSGMTWDEAHAFCAWAGGRLPTHASLSRAQSPFNFHSTLPLAELASTFGEMLVFEKLVAFTTGILQSQRFFIGLGD